MRDEQYWVHRGSRFFSQYVDELLIQMFNSTFDFIASCRSMEVTFVQNTCDDTLFFISQEVKTKFTRPERRCQIRYAMSIYSEPYIIYHSTNFDEIQRDFWISQESFRKSFLEIFLMKNRSGTTFIFILKIILRFSTVMPCLYIARWLGWLMTTDNSWNLPVSSCHVDLSSNYCYEDFQRI